MGTPIMGSPLFFMNKYQYLLVDLSLLLSRNVYAVSKGKEIGEYTSGEVVKMTLQTLNKIARDYKVTSDKIILLADSWDPEYNGYYRTYLLGGNYKDSRSWMTPEKYKEISETPGISESVIRKAEADLYQNQVKTEAKHILRTEAFKIGLPCLGVPGLECDDLFYIISSLLYSSGVTKKSVMVTKDSDCMFCTSPAVDYFRLPVGGSKPEIKTYDEIYVTSVPQELRDKGLSLYEYKSLWDSLDGGHNDMRRTRIQRTNLTKVISGILDGDYSGVKDIDLFKRQHQTFILDSFPMISQAVSEIIQKLPIIGHLGSLSEFHDFCDSYGVSGISDSYYTSFIGRFSQKLFTE